MYAVCTTLPSSVFTMRSTILQLCSAVSFVHR